MKNIISKLIASALLVLFFAGLASATPIYMQIEGVDGETQVAEVNPDGTCSFKIKKPGKYQAALLLPAVQKVRESASRSTSGKDESHKEWIDVLSWSFGATNPSAREASTPSVSEVVVTKNMDKSSPMLAKGASKGKTKSELNKQTTHNGQTYYVVKMTDVLISSYSVSGQGSGDPIPMESISLNFTKIEWNYKPIDPAQPAVAKGGWNLKENVK